MIYDVLTPFECRSLEARAGAEYCARMMHRVPSASVVQRLSYITSHCLDRRVLNLGCASGPMHEAIRSVASSVTGVDREPPADGLIDLDQAPGQLNDIGTSWDIVIMGEILEHLSNPGNLLRVLHRFGIPMIITVPNAFCDSGHQWIQRGYEQVNPDHVAWYSYHTLKMLVERHGFTVQEFCWYNGKPFTAEGLIFLVRSYGSNDL